MAKQSLSGGPCWLCRRRDDGVGYMLRHNARPVWSCSEHLHLVKKGQAMSQREFDIYEGQALHDAMCMAADRLDRLGTGDLNALSEVQAVEFFRGFLDDFGTSLADKLEKLDPPF
ncbi:hypothetical protein [Roseibium sp. RKSG952]|uniref:hypothetical protein n=1 Tax=Roseibium sp. RKSG952 TaxID=2529384 RepID=UPI0012BBE4C6|nr:hypothetical protein [Roseibium sp. RKSG952]MTH96659.1 hypothetical protein [Roseibium sp. RKSG952]